MTRPKAVKTIAQISSSGELDCERAEILEISTAVGTHFAPNWKVCGRFWTMSLWSMTHPELITKFPEPFGTTPCQWAVGPVIRSKVKRIVKVVLPVLPLNSPLVLAGSLGGLGQTTSAIISVLPSGTHIWDSLGPDCAAFENDVGIKSTRSRQRIISNLVAFPNLTSSSLFCDPQYCRGESSGIQTFYPFDLTFLLVHNW